LEEVFAVGDFGFYEVIEDFGSGPGVGADASGGRLRGEGGGELEGLCAGGAKVVEGGG
jgi:hypothetical protein